MIGVVQRFRTREFAIAQALDAVACREFRDWLDYKRVLFDEYIDDELRHQHARDGIPCPICSVAAGAECIYGVHAGRPAGARYPGKVHTRRLMKFHDRA